MAGSFPFDSSSATEMVQMHILKELLPVHKLDPNIPLLLSDMVSKLMEKDVDLRYQTAKGILHDIELIISEYKSGNKMTVGERDVSEILVLP